MKSTKDFREGDDFTKKPQKLDPIRKSGKERHAIFKALDEDEDDIDLMELHQRESAYDYIDDGDEEEEEYYDEDADDTEEVSYQL